MHGTTTGEDIFNCVYDLLQKYNLPQSKLTSVATDGAPSITGKTNGFVALLRKKLSEISEGSNIHHTHCIIHQEVLCTKVKRRTDLCGVDLLAERLGSRTRAPPLRQSGSTSGGDTHDIPQTTSKKIIYADDTAILAQAKTFEELEIQLNKDLETLHNYFENWSLRLNPAKSVHCCFHLNHHRAERKLNLFINNSQITHSEHPKYLGIHLDRTLTFKTHLTKLKGKLSSRNNILHKLAGSSWGSDANTLRTSALALIFSTAEYCAPVWEGSCHTKLIDTQLNSTLRIITGVSQPTRIDWLPVLAHISPPELRRKEATKKMYQKLLDSPDLEINPILQSPPNHRLKSRRPIWSRGNQLLSQNFNISEAWTNTWISSDIPNKNLITSPNVKIPGFSLPRREWVLLNRFRTGPEKFSNENIFDDFKFWTIFPI
ncbi:hypothetical protein LAZ67_15000638 [Cordylochernes scorpioides]|uniref:Reverse transcriptase domain-containing protein n=1 Tax=Cordylochernes scorpioides TaxID=51811 RepID=A0ABY6LBQ9_9ARAC|nr:hypothetical protein LAZ67_15000638 [Cordylochernes scorpioides]